ncbi:MAG: hypothetical protein QG575_5 [Euryarchaeota archaeon]|nr:hypothetical protein [Euryarchaeota archaeon]
MRILHYFSVTAFASTFFVLLALSAWAMPDGNPVWTEESWTKSGDASLESSVLENRVTTLSDPIYFNLSGNEPQSIRLGERQLNYSDYLCSAAYAPLSSELWIRKEAVWSRYEQVRVGEVVNLVVHIPRDGSGDIYLISYANSTIMHWNFKFLAGYYRLRLMPEESGRLFMLLAQASEPGNALILDVLPRQSEPSFSPLDVNSILMGDAFVTIKSQRIKGYDVFVDGVFYCNDNSDGSLDGIASLTIGGGKTHTITVSQRDGLGGIINKNEHTKNFKRETAYTLLID